MRSDPVIIIYCNLNYQGNELLIIASRLRLNWETIIISSACQNIGTVMRTVISSGQWSSDVWMFDNVRWGKLPVNIFFSV